MITGVFFDGLDVNETLKKINDLKRSIKRLERKMRKDIYAKEIIVTIPSDEDLLFWYKKFLKDGIKHLENDLHVEYERTQKELKEKEFVDKLKHIKKFKFSYGLCKSLPKSKVVLVFDNKKFNIDFEDVDKQSCENDWADNDGFYLVDNDRSKKTFLENMSDINLECWKKKRKIKDNGCLPMILDEPHYKIEIEYYDNLKKDIIEGDPYNNESFFRLVDYIIELVGDYIEGKSK